MKRRMVVLFVVALMSIGGGVSIAAAENITPGRFLYVDFDVVVGEGTSRPKPALPRVPRRYDIHPRCHRDGIVVHR